MKIIGCLLLGGLLILSTALSVGCAAATRPMEGEEDVIGFITGIHPPEGPGASGQIVVESHADKIVTRYVITVTDETLIFRQEGDGLREAAFKAFEDKQWVKLWFSGSTAGSDPVRGTAAQVVIEEKQ